MENLKCPSWLKAHIKEIVHKENPAVVSLCSSSGSEHLELKCFGELIKVKGEDALYIVSTLDNPALVVAKDPQTGELFVIFDGACHGYNNMFCDEYEPMMVEHRQLELYSQARFRILAEFGYSIDYEDEKEDYEFDDEGNTILINGTTMPWEQVKTDGIDYFALYLIDEQGQKIQIMCEELA